MTPVAGTSIRMPMGAARPMGDFVVTERKRVPGTEKAPRTLEESRRIEREQIDGQHVATLCALCDWFHEGTLGEGRDLAQAHRTDAHPDLRPGKRNRKQERADAIRAASVRSTSAVRRVRSEWTEQTVLGALRRFAVAHGHPPAHSDLKRDPALPSAPTVAKFWGSLPDAVEALGFARPTKSTYYQRPAGGGQT